MAARLILERVLPPMKAVEQPQAINLPSPKWVNRLLTLRLVDACQNSYSARRVRVFFWLHGTKPCTRGYMVATWRKNDTKKKATCY